MGFFTTKSKKTSLHGVKKSTGTNTVHHSSSRRIKLKASGSSSTTEDDDVSIVPHQHNKKNHVHRQQQTSKSSTNNNVDSTTTTKKLSATASPMKNKFWRLQEDGMDDTVVDYIPPPPGGLDTTLTTTLRKQHHLPASMDPFEIHDSRKNNNTAMSENSNKKKMFRRLVDSVDDDEGSVPQQQHHTQNKLTPPKKQLSTSKSFRRLESTDDGSRTTSTTATTMTDSKSRSVMSGGNNKQSTATSSSKSKLLRTPPSSSSARRSPKKVSSSSGAGLGEQQPSSKKLALSSHKAKKTTEPLSSYQDDSSITYGGYQPPLFPLGDQQNRLLIQPPIVLDSTNGVRTRQNHMDKKKKKKASTTTSSENNSYDERNENKHRHHDAGATRHGESSTKNGFLLDVIRHSVSEETFDVRSAYSGSSIFHNNNNVNNNKSRNDTATGRFEIQRTESMGLQSHTSGMYSETTSQQSGGAFSTESSGCFPSANGGQNFRQIMFDNDNKVAKVTKSDTGASDFSDFIKAASKLTSNLRKDSTTTASRFNDAPKETTGQKWKQTHHHRATKEDASSSSNPWPSLASKPNRHRDEPSYGLSETFAMHVQVEGSEANHGTSNHHVKQKNKIGVQLPTSKKQLSAATKHDGSLSMQWNMPAPKSKHQQQQSLVNNKDSIRSFRNNNDDDGVQSQSSNQSSQKSRQEFHAAIRAKTTTTSPFRPLVSHTSGEEGHRCRTLSSQSQYHNIRAATPMAFSSSEEEEESIETNAVSDANATFAKVEDVTMANNLQSNASSNAADLFGQPFDDMAHKHNDPFLVASDFNVTNFSQDEDIDPFHIGETLAASDDSTWNVNANPFPTVGKKSSNDSNASSSSQQSDTRGPTNVGKASSMDDGLIAAIKKASTKQEKRIDPDSDSHRRDPSPRAVQPSHSDSVLEYSRHLTGGGGISGGYGPSQPQHRNQKKNPPKAVPTNAILGSMLFRQTQSLHSAEDIYNSKAGPKRKESSPPCAPDDDVDDDDEGGEGSRAGAVPRSVLANDGAESIVSSVTEEASSFYNKSFGNSEHWSRQAQNVLNHYNVKKRTLQSRDGTAAANYGGQYHLHHPPNNNSRPHHHSYQHQQHPPLTRVEEQHANMFRSEA